MELGSGDTAKRNDHWDLPTFPCIPGESNKWGELVDRYPPCWVGPYTTSNWNYFRDSGNSSSNWYYQIGQWVFPGVIWSLIYISISLLGERVCRFDHRWLKLVHCLHLLSSAFGKRVAFQVTGFLFILICQDNRQLMYACQAGQLEIHYLLCP